MSGVINSVGCGKVIPYFAHFNAGRKAMKQNKLTIYILAAMIAGIVAGIIINKTAEPDTIESISKNIKLLATIFIRMVQMIIAPLVFTTLVVGIA